MVIESTTKPVVGMRIDDEVVLSIYSCAFDGNVWCATLKIEKWEDNENWRDRHLRWR